VTTTFTTRQQAAAGPEAAASGPAIRIAGVSKRFGRGTDTTVALESVHLDVEEREFLCVVGASGCGKSTLLNLIAGLDKPTDILPSPEDVFSRLGRELVGDSSTDQTLWSQLSRTMIRGTTGYAIAIAIAIGTALGIAVVQWRAMRNSDAASPEASPPESRLLPRSPGPTPRHGESEGAASPMLGQAMCV